MNPAKRPKIDSKVPKPKQIFIGNDKKGRYRLDRIIGRGGFGRVYLGVRDDVKNGKHVAVKMEPMESGGGHSSGLYGLREREYRMYEMLKGGIGIPRVRWFGQEKALGMNVLVMELLGPDLEQLFEFCLHSFTLKTVLMLANQMLDIMEYIHSKGIIHRDLKPDNFLMGMGKYNLDLFLVDFGLAKELYNSEGDHIPYREGQRLVGTTRYVSRNAQQGIQSSRRDDMESIGYILMYFNARRLPWQGLRIPKGEKHEKVLEIKDSISIEALCKGFPEEFTLYFEHCDGLEFDEEPNYAYLRELFQNLFQNLGYRYDNKYDWLKCVKHPSNV